MNVKIKKKIRIVQMSKW